MAHLPLGGGNIQKREDFGPTRGREAECAIGSVHKLIQEFIEVRPVLVA